MGRCSPVPRPTIGISVWDGWRVGAENTYLGIKAVHPFTGVPVLHRCGVCISVRFGKSMMCSLAQPAWYILQMTSTIVSVVGHTANFAERRLGGRMQRFLRKYSEVLGIPLKPGPVPMSEFEFEDESLLSFAGWEAGVLGEGRGQGILDDLLKSRELASSEKHREKIREFLSGDWPTRATPVRGLPPPSEVWVGSRIHAEDPHGMFVVEEDDPTKPKQGWYLIHRPALLTNSETGEERSACEAMVPLADIQNVRRMDPFVFQAQYQNDPRPVEGTGFPKAEAWPRYRVSGDYLVPLDGAYAGREIWPDDRFGVIDLAQSQSSKADYTVVAVYDYHRESRSLFLRFVARERVNVLDHMKWIRDTVRPIQRDRPLKYAVVENSTLSAALLEFSGRKAGYFGFPIREVNRPHRGRGTGARVLSKNQRIALYAPGDPGRDSLHPRGGRGVVRGLDQRAHPVAEHGPRRPTRLWRRRVLRDQAVCRPPPRLDRLPASRPGLSTRTIGRSRCGGARRGWTACPVGPRSSGGSVLESCTMGGAFYNDSNP